MGNKALEQFAKQLENDVQPGDLSQRKDKYGNPKDFWVLNHNNTAINPHWLKQYARITFRSNAKAFRVKVRGDKIAVNSLRYGKISKSPGGMWSKTVPSIIYHIYLNNQCGPEYKELVLTCKSA